MKSRSSLEVSQEASKLKIAKSRGDPKSDELDALIRSNGLVFRQSRQLSVVQSHRLQEVYPETSGAVTGGSQPLNFTFNLGSDFVCWPNSWLEVSLSTLGTAAAETSGFGQGSAANILSECIFLSQSGMEILRETNKSLYVKQQDYQSQKRSYFQQDGQIMGYGLIRATEGDGIPLAASTAQLTAGNGVYGTAVKFAIPMSRVLHGLNINKLLPGIGFLSGSRLQITTAAIEQAFLSSAATVVSYQISSARIMLDTYSLANSVLQRINEVSANNGLEVEMPTYAHVSQSITSTGVQLDFREAVSRATECFAVARLNSSVSSKTADSLASKAYNFSSYRFQLGSEYMPVNSVTDPVTAYMHATHYLRSKMLYSDVDIGSISYLGYTAAYSAASIFGGGHGFVATPLERFSLVSSGVMVNGSRILSLSGTELDGASSLSIDMFVKYIRLARIYFNKLQVDK